MRGLIKSDLAYPNLWRNCVGAWCPSVSRSRSTILEDFSPARNHGTLTLMDPATDWVVSGGKAALDFSPSDDRVVVTNTASLQLAGPLTMAAWVEPLNGATNQGIIAKHNTTGSNRSYGMYLSSTEVPSGIISQTGTGTTNTVTGPSSLALSTWSHVAVVYVPSVRLTLFVNGLQVAENTTSIATTAYVGSTADVWLGAIFTPDNNTLVGRLDDVRLYNTALSDKDIALLSLRRGIAYETRRNRSYKSAAVGGSFLPNFINHYQHQGVM